MCFTTCDPVPDKPTQHAHMLRHAWGYAYPCIVPYLQAAVVFE